MAIAEFPPIESASEEGLLAIGGDLEVESLLLAYKQGIFPWPISADYPLAWFSPDPRGILFCDDLHVSKSLAKLVRKNKFTIKFNTQFKEVVEACARSKNRKGEIGTWITPDIKWAYYALYQAGYAYSVEAYNEDEKLVGGLYGVNIGSMFSGESMFYLESNASKVALVTFIQKLKDHGVGWFDTQMVTSITEGLGAKEISRKDFLPLVFQATSKTVNIF